jgi:hypothetical protein
MGKSGVYLEQLLKTTINRSKDNRSVGEDLNPRLSEYKAGVLTAQM